MIFIFALLAAVLTYLIPLGVGLAMQQLWKKSLSLLQVFIVGQAIILITALLFSGVNIIFSGLFSTFFLVIPLLSAVGILSTLPRSAGILKQLGRYEYSVAALLLSLAAVSYGIWLWSSPFNLNWDFYQHQALSEVIRRGEFSFFTTRLSDTFGFNSYPPVFHLNIALAQRAMPISAEFIQYYWQITSFLHLLSIGAVSYALAKAVTGNRLVGVLSMILGVLIFESTIAFTSFFFLPQTLAAVLGVSMLTHLISKVKKGSTVSLQAIVLTASMLVLHHYVIGSLIAVIVLATWFYFRFVAPRTGLPGRVAITILFSLAAAGGYWLSTQLNLDSLNRGEASQYTHSIPDTLGFIHRSYGYSLFLLLPLGVIAAGKWRSRYLWWMCLLLIGFSAIILSEFPYMFKFYTLARFWVHLFMAIGLAALIHLLHSRVMKGIAIIAVVATFLTLLTLNSAQWKQGLAVDNTKSHVTAGDLAAADFLREMYHPDSTLLISDPTTQFIFEGLSGINSPGGVFATPEYRQSIYRIFTSSDSVEIHDLAKQMVDTISDTPSIRVLAVSGRSYDWVRASEAERLSFGYNIWKPDGLSIEEEIFISRLNETENFSLVYRNQETAIFEVK
ncbi:MAG: hypothetical protein M3Q81_01650 [bacterium]|nr:hypothetical protein [bacterium]